MSVVLPELRRAMNSARWGHSIFKEDIVPALYTVYEAQIMPHQLLIVDSRDRLAGGTESDFFVNLRGAVEDVRAVRLLYADIPSPDGDTEPYYLIQTSLGSHVRGAVEGASSGTFVVPRNAAAGFRTIHTQNSTFPAVVFETPQRSLSSLAVSVRVRGGGSANLTAEWYMVLEVICG